MLWTALAVPLLVLVAFGTWFLTHDDDERRHAAASQFRRMVGPPEPPAQLSLPDMGGDGSTPFLWVPDAVEAEPSVAPPRPNDLEGASFVLLLGADNRNEKRPGRTDTMILVGVRDRDGAVGAVSLPRDLWIALPDVGTLHEEGRTHARLSSVVRVGELRLGKGMGLDLLRLTLEQELGIRIDRYVQVDLQGFIEAVDAVGGVDVDVQCPIQDCFWLDGTDQACTPLDVEAGRVHMDGETALLYARSRHGTGDFDRTRRQQTVVLALARKAKKRGLKGLRRTWDAVSPHVETDLDFNDAAYYASFAIETDLKAIGGFSVKRPLTKKHVTEDNKHVLTLDRDLFDEKFGTLFEGQLTALKARRKCPEPDAALTYKDKKKHKG